MTNAARALTQAIRRRPDRYELRLDFELGLYSVANYDRDSLDLDFIARKYLAEQDDRVGAFDFGDLITHSRAEVAQVASLRNADRELEFAAIGAPRESHHPPARLVGPRLETNGEFETDLSGYTVTGNVAWASPGKAVFTQTAGSGGQIFQAVSAPNKWVRVVIRHKVVSGMTRLRLSVRNFGDTAPAPGARGLPGGGNLNGEAATSFEVLGDAQGFGIRIFTDQDGEAEIDLFGCIEIQHGSEFGGVDVGYLREPARTNVCLSSNDFGNATHWARQGTTITPNAAIAPDGTMTADLIVADTSTGNHRVYNRSANTFTPTVGKNSCFTPFLKAGGYDFVKLRLFRSGTDSRAVALDLRTGEVTDVGVSFDGSYVVESWGDWFRFGIINDPTNGTSGSLPAAGIEIAVLPTGSLTSSWTGDGVGGVYAWGGQVEPDSGRFTMPIPTTDAAVTRAADESDLNLASTLPEGMRSQPFTIVMTASVPGGYANGTLLLRISIESGLRILDIVGWTNADLNGSTAVAYWRTSGSVDSRAFENSNFHLGRSTVVATVEGLNGGSVSVDGGAIDSPAVFNDRILSPAALIQLGPGVQPAILYHKLKVISRALTDAELIAESTP